MSRGFCGCGGFSSIWVIIIIIIILLLFTGFENDSGTIL